MSIKRIRGTMIVGMITLFLALGSYGCAKQQEGDPPGKAAISNIKQGLDIAKTTITGVKIALPLIKQLDAEDQKVARIVLDDIAKARDTFATKLGPYDHFDSTNAAEIKQLANDTVDTLDELNATGVTHIKNPDAQALASLAIEAIRGVVNMVLRTNTSPTA